VRLAERARALVEADFDVRPNAARLRDLFARTVRAEVAKAVAP
jgi:hypothetical protein